MSNFSKTRIYQQDIETGLLHLVHRNSLALAHLLHEALSAGVHHALQRRLPLLPHGQVVPHVDERAALQDRLCLPQRTWQLRNGKLARGHVGQTAELEDERLKHQQRRAIIAWWWWMCQIRSHEFLRLVVSDSRRISTSTSSRQPLFPARLRQRVIYDSAQAQPYRLFDPFLSRSSSRGSALLR